MSLKQWLKRNKEGAIVGGILGGIGGSYFLGKSLSSYFIEQQTFGCGGLLESPGTFPCGLLTIIIFVILGALIGAFIDSKWKPLR